MNEPESKLRSNAVLIVDDTPANIGVLRNILEGEGYQIFAATSGPLALKVAQQTPPDLILLDVMMPGMDGFETCRQLKACAQTRDVPVIFVTARTETEDIVEGFLAGAVDYINKPVRHEEVCARVRTQLQVRHYVEVQRGQAERFRGIVNNMAEGLLIIEPNGRIQFANPSCNHLLGYTDDELPGRSIVELLPGPLGQEYLDYFLTHAAVAPHSMLRHGPREVSMQRRDGGSFSLDFTVTPLFLQQMLFIGLLHDITQHKQSENELLRIARVDPLTNLANRRHFDAILQQEWHRAQRNGLPLALLLLDVDHFKLYNDSLGHQAGDHCLQQVAQAINLQAHRPTDLAARYGGEEFVLLFAETGADNAMRLAEMVRARIEALQLPHPNSSTSAWVTVSIGASAMSPKPAMEIEQLFAAADAALYRAKAQGRNRVELASPSQG